MSWVIINKETNEGVFETFNKKVILKINTKKYKAIPIKEYLSSLNIKK